MPKKRNHNKGKRKAERLFQTPDRWSNPIHCTVENWVTHIIAEHPELIGREADVILTIQDPDVVSPSTKTGMAFGHERRFEIDTIRAITYYDDPSGLKDGTTSGNLGTAYPIDTVNYTSRVGEPIYQKVQPTDPEERPIVEGEEKEGQK